MDWHAHLGGEKRRIGLGHALMNSVALVCYGLSLLARLQGRGAGRSLSFLGISIATLAAYLGGHLVYFSRSAVRREPEAEMPTARSLSLDGVELQDGELRRVELAGYPVVIGKQDGRLFAMGDVCPHLGCSLADGVIEGEALRCRCHGSEFSLADGSVVTGPATFSVPCFDVDVTGSRVVLAPRAFPV
jgi:nitrite reductase/ring-hydroxylating ferredoxin subunit